MLRRLGFFAASNPSQDRAEAAFLAVPTPQQAEKWSRQLTEEPHVAGTPGDRALAEMVRDRLKEYGFDSTIVSYSVLLNYPKQVTLRLVEPVVQELTLVESGESRDKDSYSSDAFPGRIYKLSLDGTVLGVLGKTGKLPKQFGWIHEMACPSENVLLVAEILNWRVQKLILKPTPEKTAAH